MLSQWYGRTLERAVPSGVTVVEPALAGRPLTSSTKARRWWRRAPVVLKHPTGPDELSPSLSVACGLLVAGVGGGSSEHLLTLET